jgi:hypothetical protein
MMQPMPKDWWLPALAGWAAIGAFFQARRFWVRTGELPRSERASVRWRMVSAFVGALSASVSVSAFVIWSGAGSRLAFVCAIFALEVSLTCWIVMFRAC